MKTALIVYSLSGNNLALANDLQSRFSADVFIIDKKKKKSGLSVFLDIAFNRTPSIDAPFHVDAQYDHYVFIAPIWAGKIASPMKAFLKREAGRIANNFSFATVCGGGANTQQHKIENELRNITGYSPVSFLDLWVTNLFKKLSKKPATIVSAYRINEADIQAFRPEIKHFVAEIKAAEYELTHHSS